MDIDYLLILQDFRNAIDNGLTPFMEMISLFAVTYLMLVPVFLYWCVDKRSGLYTLTSLYVCRAVNATVKLSVCAYRPWIRDERVLPAGDSKTTATGYSFPSGHTSMAVPVYGGLAVSAWKKMRWVSVLCVICLLLTGFSRNYLGVHTPQDVLVAMAEGVLVLWGVAALMKYLDRHPEREDWFLAGGIVFGIAALIFVTNKVYPRDLKEDGTLLVDPIKMIRDGYSDIGGLIAFCVGRFIEKTWIRYRPALTVRTLAAGMAGVVLGFFMIETIKTPLTLFLGDHWGSFTRTAVLALYYVAGWPLVLKMVARREAETA